MKQKQFPFELKKEVLGKVAQGAKVADVAEEYGITVQAVYGWKRKMRDQELDSVVEKAPRVKHSGINPKYVRSLEEKLRESNEKLGELYLIVDALKKMDQGSLKSASSYIVTGKPWDRLKRRAK